MRILVVNANARVINSIAVHLRDHDVYMAAGVADQLSLHARQQMASIVRDTPTHDDWPSVRAFVDQHGIEAAVIGGRTAYISSLAEHIPTYATSKHLTKSNACVWHIGTDTLRPTPEMLRSQSSSQSPDSHLQRQRQQRWTLPRVQVMSKFHIEHRGGWKLVQQAIQSDPLLAGPTTQSEHRRRPVLLLYDVLETHFLWGPATPITEPWMGILHLTPQVPHHLTNLHVGLVLQHPSFVKSLETCKGLITLCEYLRAYVSRSVRKTANVPVHVIRHPTDTHVPLFDWQAYLQNKSPKLIQIGQQLRRVSSIYRVPIPPSVQRWWLTGTQNIERMHRVVQDEVHHLGLAEIDRSAAHMAYLESFEEYDQLMTKNVVFLDLYDSTANNTVVECIARNTPVVINRTPGALEYLGKEYPLYFNHLDEVPALLSPQRVYQAHLYLTRLDKQYLQFASFCQSLRDVLETVAM